MFAWAERSKEKLRFVRVYRTDLLELLSARCLEGLWRSSAQWRLLAGKLIESGRYRDRTDDLYRVKVALIPAELSARTDFENYRLLAGRVSMRCAH